MSMMVPDERPPPWPLHEKFDDLLQSVYRLTDRILKLEMAANPHHDMVVAAPVSRQEYDELFLAITRLTDRIEALESKLRLYEPVKLGDVEFDSMVPVQR